MSNLVTERYNKLFNIKPMIYTNNLNDIYEKFAFIYSIDRLLSTGFVLKGDIKDEIDKIIVFCKVEL